MGKINDKVVLVTGANGMIAAYLVYFLMFLHQEKKLNIHLIALSRNLKKSCQLFETFISDENFTLINQDVISPIFLEIEVDYVFHFAGNSSPYFIKNDPVGIIKTNLLGTLNLLELIKQHSNSKFIFASTREVYGNVPFSESLSENSFGALDPLDKRSSYPESKRAAETLCRAFYDQFSINYNILRIAHAYGPGIKLSNDGRIMSDLLNDVYSNHDIVLKSNGQALRAFCYLTDVISGIMYVTLLAPPSEAYNLSNEDQELSILQLSQILLNLCPNKNLKIKFDIPETESGLYCSYKRKGLDCSKLKLLGWDTKVQIEDGLRRVYKNLNII